MIIQDYLKAGYPAILLLTQEPHRAENLLPHEGGRFCRGLPARIPLGG